MRDEIDGRLWTAHHEAFADAVDKGLGLFRAGLSRLGSWDGSTAHLLSLFGAFALTALSFDATAI